MNKEQLVQYFSGLDLSTLQKLYKYSKLLIIPDEDLLTNVTMTQMVEKAHNLADALFPEWTDRSKSDFGQFLIELFALFSEKDFWYINAFANESILRKMRSYSNVFSKVSSMGYNPTLCRGSSADFSVYFKKGESIRYERGDLIVKVGDLEFTNDSAIDIETLQEETSKVVTLHEGSWVSEDTTFNGYCIMIRKKDIDIESISVVIDNINYDRVGNFGQSAESDTHFMVLPEEDGSCSIFFGTNGFGATPEIGKTVSVEYRTCSGQDGNTRLVKEVSIGDSLSDREATKAEMLTSATGGTFAETLTSMKERAPILYNAGKAIINDKIAKEVLESFSFIHKASVVTSGRQVAFYIIPTSGNLEPSNEELAILTREFIPYLMLGYEGLYTENIYRDLLVTADPSADKLIVELIVSPGYKAETIESAVRQILTDLTSPLLKANYGVGFKKADADLIIRTSISGIQSTSFKLRNSTGESVMPDVSLNTAEIFQPINQDEVEVRINFF